MSNTAKTDAASTGTHRPPHQRSADLTSHWKPATPTCSAPGTPADKASAPQRRPAPLRRRRTGRDAQHPRWYFSDLRGSAADNATHGEGENHLMGGATRAETIDYLSHAYGPVFVGVLIKHLPNLDKEMSVNACARCRYRSVPW